MDFDDEGRTVDLIKADHQSEGQTVCCQEVFKLWLKGPNATWGNLFDVANLVINYICKAGFQV